MATSDKVFLRAFAWFKAAIEFVRAEGGAVDLPLGAADPLADALADALRTKLGLELDKTEAQIDPATFAVTRAESQSLALATLVTGEAMSTLRTLGPLIEQLQNGESVELEELSGLVQQIKRLTEIGPGKPPAAYSVAKLLLIVSRDAEEPDAKPPARRLIHLLKGKDPDDANDDLEDADIAEPQAILGLWVMALGFLIDRSFADDGAAARGPAPREPIALPDGKKTKTFKLFGKDGTEVKNRLNLTLGYDGDLDPERLFAQLASDLAITPDIGDEFALGFTVNQGVTVAFELPPLDPLPASFPKPLFDKAFEFGITFGRKSSEQPLLIGKADQTHFSIGELTGTFKLKEDDPRLEFDLKDSKLVIKIGDDPFLGEILGDQVEIALAFGLVADRAGGLRLKDGTGLTATIPLEQIPNSPVQIPYLFFDVRSKEAMNRIEIELSASMQALIGPFSGSIERMGVLMILEGLVDGPAKDPQWAFKPPTGAGLAIDAGGVIKGGGYLFLDPDRGEYGGILDIKLLQIGVKAIGLLGTKNPQGWSLLLIITAQLPPIQLGFGFTLTGLGGLIGVQHTLDKDALASGLSTGSLDSFLFPQNPVANAPQLFNQLRVIFPFRAGGFVIGPMLELGWPTPGLVTARLGLLIEPSQIVVVGQVVVQLPPLIDKDLALLYLQVDFAGGVVFDPFQVWFDGVLRDSRVLFISLYGQFAFRLTTGDHPTFLLSAGGFHPRFTDLPPGIPSPFRRVGCEFSIGIVGLKFEGYFAVTSASVQGGSSFRVWGDVGIAAFEGGFEFNAIIYLAPRFRFEVDIHVFAGVEVFGIDFASVDIYGLLAGPGRWRLVGKATIHTPWPLPDFSFGVDESWGEDRQTVVRRVTLLSQLKPELENAGNWSAQLAQADQAFASFVLPAPPKNDEGKPTLLLAHPNAVLQFMQKRLPLGKTLQKLGTDGIEGETAIAIEHLLFGAFVKEADKTLDDNFSTSQFLKLKEDEMLSKPSFDRFEAGLEVGQRDYAFRAAVPEVFDYEEVNLSIDDHDSGLLGMPGLTLAQHRDWALDLGAAARSPLRRKQALRPRETVKIAVKPPPLATIDTAAGTLAAGALQGRARTSYFHAEDAAAAANATVVETFETMF